MDDNRSDNREQPPPDQGVVEDAAGIPQQSNPWLLCLGRHAVNQPVSLKRAVTLIGSRHNANLHLISRRVSKAHALILNDQGCLYLRDLGSRTQTFVNGTPVREAILRAGDRLSIASFQFEISGPTRPGPAPSASAAPPGEFRIAGSEMAIPVEQRVIVIGHRASCDIHLLEESVSTTHAVIVEIDGVRYVRDLGSRTGTYVNGQRVDAAQIMSGDSIRIGQTDLQYVVSGMGVGAGAGLDVQPDEFADLDAALGTAPLAPDALDPLEQEAEAAVKRATASAEAEAAAAAAAATAARNQVAAADTDVPLSAPPTDAPPSAPAQHQSMAPTGSMAVSSFGGTAAARSDEETEIDLATDPDVNGPDPNDTVDLPPAAPSRQRAVLSAQIVDAPDYVEADAEPGSKLVGDDLASEQLSSSATHAALPAIADDNVEPPMLPDTAPPRPGPPPNAADEPLPIDAVMLTSGRGSRPEPLEIAEVPSPPAETAAPSPLPIEPIAPIEATAPPVEPIAPPIEPIALPEPGEPATRNAIAPIELDADDASLPMPEPDDSDLAAIRDVPVPSLVLPPPRPLPPVPTEADAPSLDLDASESEPIPPLAGPAPTPLELAVPADIKLPPAPPAAPPLGAKLSSVVPPELPPIDLPPVAPLDLHDAVDPGTPQLPPEPEPERPLIADELFQVPTPPPAPLAPPGPDVAPQDSPQGAPPAPSPAPPDDDAPGTEYPRSRPGKARQRGSRPGGTSMSGMLSRWRSGMRRRAVKSNPVQAEPEPRPQRNASSSSRQPDDLPPQADRAPSPIAPWDGLSGMSESSDMTLPQPDIETSVAALVLDEPPGEVELPTSVLDESDAPPAALALDNAAELVDVPPPLRETIEEFTVSAPPPQVAPTTQTAVAPVPELALEQNLPEAVLPKLVAPPPPPQMALPSVDALQEVPEVVLREEDVSLDLADPENVAVATPPQPLTPPSAWMPDLQVDRPQPLALKDEPQPPDVPSLTAEPSQGDLASESPAPQTPIPASPVDDLPVADVAAHGPADAQRARLPQNTPTVSIGGMPLDLEMGRVGYLGGWPLKIPADAPPDDRGTPSVAAAPPEARLPQRPPQADRSEPPDASSAKPTAPAAGQPTQAQPTRGAAIGMNPPGIARRPARSTGPGSVFARKRLRLLTEVAPEFVDDTDELPADSPAPAPAQADATATGRSVQSPPIPPAAPPRPSPLPAARGPSHSAEPNRSPLTPVEPARATDHPSLSPDHPAQTREGSDGQVAAASSPVVPVDPAHDLTTALAAILSPLPDESGASRRARRRLSVPVVLLVMITCMAGAAAAIWQLFPPRSRVQGVMLFHNYQGQTTARRTKLNSDLHELLLNPTIRQNARAIAISRGATAGFLDDPTRLARYTASAAWSTTTPGQWELRFDSGDPRDQERLQAWLDAVYNDPRIAELAARSAAARQRLQLLRDAYNRSQALAAEQQEQVAALERKLGSVRTGSDLEAMNAELTGLARIRDQAIATIARVQTELDQLTHSPADDAGGAEVVADPGPASTQPQQGDRDLQSLRQTAGELDARMKASRTAARDRAEQARSSVAQASITLQDAVSAATAAGITVTDQNQPLLEAIRKVQQADQDVSNDLTAQRELTVRLGDLRELLDEKLAGQRARVWETDQERVDLNRRLAASQQAELASSRSPATAPSAATAAVPTTAATIDDGHDGDDAKAIADLRQRVSNVCNELIGRSQHSAEALTEASEAMAGAAPALVGLGADQQRTIVALQRQLMATAAAHDHYVAAVKVMTDHAARTTLASLPDVGQPMAASATAPNTGDNVGGSPGVSNQVTTRLSAVELKQQELAEAQKTAQAAAAAYADKQAEAQLAAGTLEQYARASDALATARQQLQADSAALQAFGQAPAALYADQPAVRRVDEPDPRPTLVIFTEVPVLAVFVLLLMLAARGSGPSGGGNHARRRRYEIGDGGAIDPVAALPFTQDVSYPDAASATSQDDAPVNERHNGRPPDSQ